MPDFSPLTQAGQQRHIDPLTRYSPARLTSMEWNFPSMAGSSHRAPY